MLYTMHYTLGQHKNIQYFKDIKYIIQVLVIWLCIDTISLACKHSIVYTGSRMAALVSYLCVISSNVLKAK